MRRSLRLRGGAGQGTAAIHTNFDAVQYEQLVRDFCGHNQLVSITFRIQINRKRLNRKRFSHSGWRLWFIQLRNIIARRDRFQLLNNLRPIPAR